MHKKGTVVDEDIYLQLLPLWGSRLLAHYQCKSIPKRSEAATVQVKSVSPANKETVKTWQTSSGIALGFRPSITGYLEPQPRESSGWSDNMFPLSLSLSTSRLFSCEPKTCCRHPVLYHQSTTCFLPQTTSNNKPTRSLVSRGLATQPEMGTTAVLPKSFLQKWFSDLTSAI